ncbi:MAG: hypothetical protein IKL82_05010 [Clostridia bacterium]|nr:hypothetical protein [Clostridia bacterium]
MKLIDKLYAWCFETVNVKPQEKPVYISCKDLFLKNYKTESVKQTEKAQ